ncbi:MAG: branched-chain amino acid aminotransferase [Alphaproteobacteria bacterium]|nr:branched-chain amino acid aminotransferase [Alphaproteobacteria bacterium]
MTDFAKRHGFIWQDGELVNWNDCKLHMLTHSLHYGGAVFEGLRSYNSKIFKLEQHTRRLRFSAELIGYSLPFTDDEINLACQEVLQANGVIDAYIRPVAWRGSKAMGIAHQDNPVMMAVAAWEWPSYYSPKKLLEGLRLRTSVWRRPSPGTAPVHSKVSGLYMICTMAKQEATDAGYDDALMLDYRGFIAESTGSNIFLFMEDGKLHTPLPDCFLDGITRQTAVELARVRGIEVVERHIAYEELTQAVEVFLTGTAVEITPIREIDGYTFTPGELSKTMIKAYDNAVRA